MFCWAFCALTCWGLVSCLHLPAWSSPTSPMDLQQFPRFQWPDGPRSLRTSALSSSAVASMTTRPAPLVTTASRCWLLLILKRRPRSCQQSLPTEDWPWWLSSACSSRHETSGRHWMLWVILWKCVEQRHHVEKLCPQDILVIGRSFRRVYNIYNKCRDNITLCLPTVCFQQSIFCLVVRCVYILYPFQDLAELIMSMFCLSSPIHIQQDGLTGSAWGDWANYTASPLRWVMCRGQRQGVTDLDRL